MVAALGVDGTQAGYLTLRNAASERVALLDVESYGARLVLDEHARRGGVVLFGGDAGDDAGGGLHLRSMARASASHSGPPQPGARSASTTARWMRPCWPGSRRNGMGRGQRCKCSSRAGSRPLGKGNGPAVPLQRCPRSRPVGQCWPAPSCCLTWRPQLVRLLDEVLDEPRRRRRATSLSRPEARHTA